MIDFAELYSRLDSTTKTSEKIDAMANYFANASVADAAWATYFLSGERLKRLVPTALLRKLAAEEANVPDWLLEESYQTVGDLAETISLIVPPGSSVQQLSLHQWVTERLFQLRDLDEARQREEIVGMWRSTRSTKRFVLMKLITGAFRVGVSKRLVTRAIAKQFQLPVDVVAHRLMGNWQPTAQFFQNLISSDQTEEAPCKPYPFCLAHALADATPESLGEVDEFLVEWKWDGIRGQIIRRSSESFIWSRGEELMEARWPEIEEAMLSLPNGTVLDGEILGMHGESVLPFSELQRRIGRKKAGKKLLREVPVVFIAFDLLELQGRDIRQSPCETRRAELEALLTDCRHPHLRINDLHHVSSWSELAKLREYSREHNAEGLMLKRKDGPYNVGRVRGNWWKWKVDPYTVEAVLIYAQKGHGKRSNLYTDYTFALWDQGKLVPFAKAYSGLDDVEIRQVDQFVRQNTSESFGPVRSVTPTLVMELAFEGLQRSTRHKSGVATRFPRILRWRKDKRPEEANQLSDLLELLSESDNAGNSRDKRS